jgi:hypothetical protein
MSAWLKILNPKVAAKVKAKLGNWVKDKTGTITGVKAGSGKIPPWIGAGGKDPGKRAKIVKTHLSNVRSDKINKAEKAVEEGKKKLKDMVETGQAEKIGERHYKKGFKD